MIDIRATHSPVIPAKAGIQYALASRFYRWRSGILGRPVKPGDDGWCTCGDPSRLFLGLSSLISDFPKNISVPTPPKSDLELWPSHPTRGAYRDRHGRGVRMRWTRQRFARDGVAGRVERLVSDHQRADERCCSVGRSRVVLTPRRWRQVHGCYVGPTGLRHNVSPWTTVTNKRGHRGELEGNR
jgi:hypothetical protein